MPPSPIHGSAAPRERECRGSAGGARTGHGERGQAQTPAREARQRETFARLRSDLGQQMLLTVAEAAGGQVANWRDRVVVCAHGHGSSASWALAVVPCSCPKRGIEFPQVLPGTGEP